MADESFAHFRGQVERVIRQARLSATERRRVLRAVEDQRLRGVALPRRRHQTKASRVATFLCSTLAYIDVELPERASDLEQLVFERLAGRTEPQRSRTTRQTVALVAAAVALLFAAAGAVPEMLGDWPYNAFGKNSRAHATHHRSSSAKSGLPGFDGA